MDTKILLDADTKVVTLSNIGQLEELDIEFDDINEAFDIAAAMEEIDALAQSGELDVESDVLRYTLVNPEEIESLECEEGTDTKEISLEEFILEHDTPQSIQDFIESAEVGDAIYLRKEIGKAHFEISVQSEKEDAKITLGYFDCSGEYDFYDLLDESYLDEVCDSILPDRVSVEDGEANLDVFDFEPQIVSGDLYKVKIDEDSGLKILERIEMPSYYFQGEMPTDEF